MVGAFLLVFYIGDTFRIPYVLVLYSFWVPQIVMNVITEARAPLHKHYIYGMSLSRLVAPLYLFAVPNNFVKEVMPDVPSDPLLCQLLVLWIGIQTAILIAQSKYGPRFMIPQRFLPPKFDYSRPLPPTMLPPGAATLDDDSSNSEPSDHGPSPNSPNRERHTTLVTTRLRRGNQQSARASETTESTETTIDCSICYDPINVRDRHGYMLGPCDHLFHRDCLVQWMDVKMECPICRTELPPL